MGCSDSLPPFPPHFVSFVMAVPCLRCGFVTPSRLQRPPVGQGFCMPVAPFRAFLDLGTTGPPRFLGNPMCTCPAPLGPRWDRTRQAKFGVSIQPSASTIASAPTKSSLSGLNNTAYTLAVYASQHGLPHSHARLASGCWPALPDGIGYPLGSSVRFSHAFCI